MLKYLELLSTMHCFAKFWRNTVFVVSGEAAGIGIGLVMLGTGSTRAIEDLLGYAKETTHEKIIRGIALGIALVMYGRVEEANELIDSLVVVSFSRFPVIINQAIWTE